MGMGSKPIEYVTYQGARMIVKRRFTYNGMAKVEIFNPVNGSMFVVDAANINLYQNE